MGNSQDFKSEFNNLFLNLPIEDSIENIINGEYDYKFEKKNYDSDAGGQIKNIDLYYTAFSKHNYFTNTPGGLAIIKIKSNDSQIIYEIHLIFAFATEENQMNGYKLIKEKFSKYADQIDSRELKDSKNKLYGFESEIIYNSYKIKLTAFKAKKKQENQVKIEYKIRKG